jgi:microsomal epoxide hydrolase
MMDSPVGIAAWILEKMHAWSDLNNNKIEERLFKR